MFSDPRKNVMQARFPLGGVVVDFGSGVGAAIEALSQSVGEKGRVIAIDIQKELLNGILREFRGRNVETLWSDLEQPKGSRLRDELAHGVVISNILSHIADKEHIIRETARITRSEGIVLVVDFAGDGDFQVELPHKSTKDEVEQLFVNNGFAFDRPIDAGLHHYGIIFRKV